MALIVAAALLLAGPGVAGASTGTPANFLVGSPGANAPNPVPCGAVAEFTTPHGFPFAVHETGGILAAFGLPGAQIPGVFTQLNLLGAYFSSLTAATPTCGSGASTVVGE